ncbi:MAG: hypothetical protein KZQ83_13340 [gamma proteobacterium symbiont of Taylorina sp.]|nr:hypothetical protein [gamma proteobacterium symbiont of Taylorina sp.]
MDRLTDVDGHWYRQAKGLIDNIPFVFEILIAESDITGQYYGVNHSPTFGDFLAGTRINAGELWASYGVNSAIGSFFNPDKHIVIVHLIGFGLPFLDRGKSKLSIPQEMIEPLSSTIWNASKTLFKEAKKEKRDIAKSEREWVARQKKSIVDNSLIDSVFEVLPLGIEQATDKEKFPSNVRSLYYKVRKLIQDYTSKKLDYTYFSQNLLIRYWQNYGRNKLIYNDPRGVLYEPHSNIEVQLGTNEVEQYNFPEFQYNKILYIEKKGLWPTIKASGLAKKYDMAIIAAEGYATEAI